MHIVDGKNPAPVEYDKYSIIYKVFHINTYPHTVFEKKNAHKQECFRQILGPKTQNV